MHAVIFDAADGRLDSTSASILDRNFDTIRKQGHVVSYGEAEGKPFANLWERLVQRSLPFTRMHLGHLDYGSAIWRRGVDEVMSGIENGAIQVPVKGVFTPETVEDMFAALALRQTAGKLILKIAA